MAQVGWLTVVRHGQSAGNVAAEAAEAAGREAIDLAERDADVPLSALGREQAESVGRWLRDLPADEAPQLAVVSPYLRTRQTADLALAGTAIPRERDERLRDRELGVLDLLTAAGVRARLPGEEERRRRLGKFYYRPPGGESWADVLLRLRSLHNDLCTHHPGARVLLFGHEAVVWLLRYLLEDLTEQQLMAAARATTLANCAVSSWRYDGGAWRPELFNSVDHLRREGTPPTRQEDVRAEPV